ncbi:MAG: hypothetical protein ABQ298_00850 [Puniceicoccaceae bacterium]
MNKRTLRLLFYSLILTLVFEGITRKFIPVSFGKFLILLKDGILVLMAFFVITMPISGSLRMLRNIYAAFALLLAPLIAYTAVKDPILAVFGAKQYLLYPFTLFGFVLGFQDYQKRDFVMPGRWLTVLLIPLTLLAVVQIFLPDSHRLNLSVTGEDLSAFKAGGRLRVSSTFPFVAQFCYYLAILLPILWVTHTLRLRTSANTLFKKLESLVVIIPFFIVANVITGSRLAVLTNVMVIAFAAGLLALRGKTHNIGRLIAFIAGISISVVAARLIVPEAFEAYEARTGDHAIVDEDELSERAGHILTGWWHIYQYQDPGMFGFGIGVMSNGVQNFSGYAAAIRDRVWGETDLANTVLEGGLYFVFIWMGTRVAIVLLCLQVYLSIQHSKLIYIAAFAMGYILFNGLTQTLGIQPPLAIWWWLAIGLLIHIKRFEVFQTAMARQKAKSARTSSNPVPRTSESKAASLTAADQVKSSLTKQPTLPKPPPPKEKRRPRPLS